MTPEDELEELLPSEQPPTDDPWVIVTSVAKAPEPEAEDVGAARPKRRRWPCPVCGAYWPCGHEG